MQLTFKVKIMPLLGAVVDSKDEKNFKWPQGVFRNKKIFSKKVLKKKVSDTDTIDSKFLIKKLDNIHELYENLLITRKGVDII